MNVGRLDDLIHLNQTKEKKKHELVRTINLVIILKFGFWHVEPHQPELTTTYTIFEFLFYICNSIIFILCNSLIFTFEIIH